ncbi:hypothetical protein E2C01_055294 [Portunus trituberculatus]|uniref:Uncharacterized protein n=1 Tax=Portunus trituberculatus TaxID=210409 RepID=A0A5B7GWF6_PORTR|nr:hypothetical protein [Portunus trituberculatus]
MRWVQGRELGLRPRQGGCKAEGGAVAKIREESTNQRVVRREVRKMSPSQKEALGRQLLEEAARETSNIAPLYPYQGTDFVNPFNTAPPTFVPEMKRSDGVVHGAALHQDAWTSLALISRHDLTSKMTAFTFALPNPTDHTGCLPGQFVAEDIDKIYEWSKKWKLEFSSKKCHVMELGKSERRPV